MKAYDKAQVTQLMKRVRRIEIKTRALTNNVFAGEYHSAFKGRGMSFSEVREYQVGDDVRDIDWNVTARYPDRTFVKVFEEERELTVMLLVDVSGSLDFGSNVQTQRELATEIAATLAFSAIRNNDKIGVVFFSDRVEKFIPPAKGRSHILYIIRELLTFEPVSQRTNLTVPIEYLMRVIKKKCIAFVISDFISDEDLTPSLSLLARKHDVVAVRVYDRRQEMLPDVGLMRVCDAETGYERYLDTSSRRVRQAHAAWWQQHNETLIQQLRRSGIDMASVATGTDYAKVLRALFARRA